MRIRVEPFGQGWSMSTDTVENLQLYLRGSAAEEAARKLAARLAVSGVPVTADVRLRNGDVIGLFRFSG